MKKFFQYILMAAFIGGTVPLTSCDDDEEVLNEWDMTYVSLLQADYLRPVPTTFNLTCRGIGYRRNHGILLYGLCDRSGSTGCNG